VVDIDTSGSIIGSSTVTYTEGWYEVEIDWKTDNTINVTLSQGGSVVATTSATDSTYTSGGFGFTYWYNSGGFDNFTSRPRVDTEPSVIFGAETGDGGGGWAANLDTVATGFSVGDIARLRLSIENTGLTATDAYEIEYAELGAAPSCEAVNGSSYATVPVFASCGTSPVCMATSTNVADGALTTDLLLETEGTFTSGRFVEDPSDTTASITLDQDRYTEIEFALKTTANVADQDLCFRVTDNGTDLDTYLKVARMSVRFDPSFGSVVLNNGSNITLTPGATTTVYASSTVTDLNGYTDLALGSSTIYRSGAGAACSDDSNNCYLSTTTDRCSFTNCSGNTCDLLCYADIYFHADPTDSGTYSGEEWLAYMEVEDQSGGTDLGSAQGVELMTLRALEVENAINYGSLAVASNTGSYNASTTVYNFGNDAIDVQISGTDLSDGDASTIPVSEQIFATSTFTYSSCVVCTTLSTSTTNYEVDIAKPTVPSPYVEDVIYWGIEIPFGVASNPHSGNNTFYAIGD
jgi:hypothetical protein